MVSGGSSAMDIVGWCSPSWRIRSAHLAPPWQPHCTARSSSAIPRVFGACPNHCQNGQHLSPPRRRLPRPPQLAKIGSPFVRLALPPLTLYSPICAASAATAPRTFPDVRFDAHGELMASCSTDGRIAVHDLQQFTAAVPRAEAAAVAAAEAVADSADDNDLSQQLLESSTAAASSAAFASALAASDGSKHAPSCEPIFRVSTRRAARACRWDPHNPSELLCAFANSHELLCYDLGSNNLHNPSRILRSGKGYQPQHGVSDIVLPPESGYIAAAGRDGQLRVWDVRARSPLVHESTTATRSFTMGVRAQDRRAGAIAALSASPDGMRLYAGTDEGCVLGWDIRSLASTCCVVRASRAIYGGGGGIVGLSHHPSLRQTLLVQLANGAVLVVDGGPMEAVMAVRPPEHQSAHYHNQQLQQQASGEAAGSGGGDAGGGAGGGGGGQPMMMVMGGGSEEANAAAVNDWSVRSRRGAWLPTTTSMHGSGGGGGGSGGGAELVWCCGRSGHPGLSHMRVGHHCSQVTPLTTFATPTPSSVVCVDAHPEGHYLAVGLRENAIGITAPVGHFPTIQAKWVPKEPQFEAEEAAKEGVEEKAREGVMVVAAKGEQQRREGNDDDDEAIEAAIAAQLEEEEEASAAAVADPPLLTLAPPPPPAAQPLAVVVAAQPRPAAAAAAAAAQPPACCRCCLPRRTTRPLS